MKLLKTFSVCHSLPSIHNKTFAERETKYSQTFVQQSPFGNGIKVTVIYTAGDGCIQVNLAENIIKATGNFGKLSGDRYIQGDCYIQVNFAENIIKATGNFGKLSGDRNIQGDCYIQVNFAENIIKATGNFGKLSGVRKIQGDRYIQGSYIQV